MEATFFRNMRNVDPDPKEMDWEGLGDQFNHHEVFKDKKDAPLISPVEWHKNEKRAGRIKQIHLYSIDADDIIATSKIIDHV